MKGGSQSKIPPTVKIEESRLEKIQVIGGNGLGMKASKPHKPYPVKSQEVSEKILSLIKKPKPKDSVVQAILSKMHLAAKEGSRKIRIILQKGMEGKNNSNSGAKVTSSSMRRY